MTMLRGRDHRLTWYTRLDLPARALRTSSSSTLMSAKISDNHTFMQQQTQRHRRLAVGRRSAATTAALPHISLGLVGVAASAFCAPASTADAIASAWSPPVEAYRSMLVAFSGSLAKGVDVPAWVATTRALRQWMIANDPDYPIYHLVAPEGWNNDPNGVTYDPQGRHHSSTYRIHSPTTYFLGYAPELRVHQLSNGASAGLGGNIWPDVPRTAPSELLPHVTPKN
eukprot:SAG31_NODE_522_length_14623_cov_6.071674_11_plen_226_part_00